ncbi:unnamed protein product [Albugo candida]|uniref:Uncharacterized protein n=1 Tax=Albugo candida TaxID=65357 RepID=A0A024GDW3_9STRA|nr:unnamed protein product [Albugo candida]|eukprot:CCI44729.1 unnamed protein product [Albugo candida]
MVQTATNSLARTAKRFKKYLYRAAVMIWMTLARKKGLKSVRSSKVRAIGKLQHELVVFWLIDSCKTSWISKLKTGNHFSSLIERMATESYKIAPIYMTSSNLYVYCMRMCRPLLIAQYPESRAASALLLYKSRLHGHRLGHLNEKIPRLQQISK